MEVSNNLDKIKLILQYVLEGKIVINENHIEKLLKCLENPDENGPGKLLLNTPCFSDFVYSSLPNISNVNTRAKVFLMQLVTILFKNELQFSKMLKQSFKESFCKIHVIQNLINTTSPDLHLACINLATVQVSHCSGLRAILERKLWENVLQPNIHLKPRHIAKAAYNFMAKLTSKLNEYNYETELIEVIKYVLEPIYNSDYFNLSVIDYEAETAHSEKMFTNIYTLLAIITEADNLPPKNIITSLLNDHFHIHPKLWKIYVVTQNKELLKIINSFKFRMFFQTLRPLLVNKKTDEFCIKMAIFHRNYIVYYGISKRDPFAIIDYVVQSNIIWSSLEKSHAAEFELPLTFEQNGQNIEFSLQIIIHLTVPMLKYTPMDRISKKLDMRNLLEQFGVKMGKTITDYIYSCCYMFGTLLDEGGINLTRKVTTHTLKEILRLKGHLKESQAGPIFQSLYYLLGMFILCDGPGEMIVDENPIEQDDLRLLTHLLDAMKMLLKEYTISWYENVEIVSIQADLLNLIRQNFLLTKQVVKVLDMIDICVKKFLSPNMSLLVDNRHRKCSTLDEIGEVVKLYAQHDEWEVRDSAFNLLNSCTEISFIKYIPLQNVITENSLMIIAAKAALNDSECYSQCTALKCLAAATKIDSIWREVLLDNIHIYYQLVYIIRNHTEGMVRKEAANVLAGVYVNQKIEPSFQNTLYEIMIMAALDDLHWEVQLAALEFWKKVIHNHLTYRGMLDGKFPSVTFSKQKRKIIVLNQEEIRRQLTGVMNDLSAIGCLTVLLECMNEINNIEVTIQAYSITKELIRILDTYKFEKVDAGEDAEEKSSHRVKDENISVDITYAPNDEERNKVIDSILSVDQSELMTYLHDNYYQTKTDEMDIDYAIFPRRKFVRPNEFLETFRVTDYSLLIDNKKNFYSDNLNSLDTLLDVILDSENIV